MSKNYHCKQNIMIVKEPFFKWFKTIEDAKLYCSLLIIDDFDDWRIPTYYESSLIYKISHKFNRSIYYHYTESDNRGEFVIPVRSRW